MIYLFTMGELSNRSHPERAGIVSFGGLMAHQAEITGLSTAVDRAAAKIDDALDQGDRREFVLWCQRRNALVARRERALLAEAVAS